jgi:dTDP-4-dehydrorhamnose reductase
MVWLIGNKGLLGSEVEKQLQKNKIEYISSDFEVDITNIKELTELVKNKNLTWAVNCAAYTQVDLAEKEKEIAMKINFTGVSNIVDVAKLYKIKIIHISTDYIFDGLKNEPYKEDDKPNPLNYYGFTKLKSEEYIIKNYAKYFIIRSSWLYGKNGKNFPLTMINLFKKNNEINVVSDQVGCPTYSKDLAGFIIFLIKNNVINYGLYHYSNEGYTDWYNFALKIHELSLINNIIDKNVKILPILSKNYFTIAERPAYSVLSKEKIKSVFNITVRNWSNALEDFIKELKN